LFFVEIVQRRSVHELVACNSQVDSVWLAKTDDSRVAPSRQSARYCLVGAPCSRRFLLSHTHYLFDCYRPPSSFW
jgi:hypothetical protein